MRNPFGVLGLEASADADQVRAALKQIYHNKYAPFRKNQMKFDKQILWIYYITFCTFRQRIAWNYLYLYDVCTQGCNDCRNAKRERDFLLTLSDKWVFVSFLFLRSWKFIMHSIK